MTRFLPLFLSMFIVTSVMAQKPSVHPSNLSVSSTTCNESNISWTNGNGDARIVVIRVKTTYNDVYPEAKKRYIGNSKFGSGSLIGNNKTNPHYVVYNGTDSSVLVTGLSTNITYEVLVFEFNVNSGDYAYLTSSGYPVGTYLNDDLSADFSLVEAVQCLSGNKYEVVNTSSNTMGAAMTYEWNFGDNTTTVTGANPTHVYTKGGIFEVKLTVLTSNCFGEKITTDTVVVPYDVHFELDSTISGNDSIQCFGSNNFTFRNTSRVPSQPIYGPWDRTRAFWTTSENHIGSAFNFDFKRKSSGAITVQLIMARQVGRNYIYCSDTFERTVYTLPPIIRSSDISINDSVQMLKNNAFTFEHSGSNVVSTTWSFDDGDSSTNNPATHQYDSVGKYTVSCIVVDSLGCKDSVTRTVEVTANVSAKDLSIEPQIHISPNPTDHILHVRSDLNLSQFEIKNTLGQALILGRLSSQNTVSTQDLPAGIYLLQLDQNRPIRFMKL